MNPFQSERLTPLTSEQIDQYERDGFLLIENGCSEDLIHAYNNHVRTLRSQDPLPSWAKFTNKEGRELTDKERFSLRLFYPHMHDGFSLEMLKLPIIRGALAQLLGDEAVGIQSMYFFKEPGSHGQAAHQDFYYIRNEPNTMIAASIAMDDTDTENGCLWVIPGSHKLGLLPHGDVKNLMEHEDKTHETEGVDLSKEIPVIMKKGDILFFHNLLIHSSTKNRSADRWRRSYVGHYIRHDSEIIDDYKPKVPLA